MHIKLKCFLTGEIGAVELDEDDEDCDEAEEITIEPGLIGDVDDIAEEEDEEQGIMEQSLQASLQISTFLAAFPIAWKTVGQWACCSKDSISLEV